MIIDYAPTDCVLIKKHGCLTNKLIENFQKSLLLHLSYLIDTINL